MLIPRDRGSCVLHLFEGAVCCICWRELCAAVLTGMCFVSCCRKFDARLTGDRMNAGFCSSMLAFWNAYAPCTESDDSDQLQGSWSIESGLKY